MNRAHPPYLAADPSARSATALAGSPEPLCIVSRGGVMRVSATQLFSVCEEQVWSLTTDYGRTIGVRTIRSEAGEKNEHCDQEGR